MEEGIRERAAYRAWAERQIYLPLYWQPRWLDLVAEGQWRAEFYTDDLARVAAVWPYVIVRRGPLCWLSKPPHTKYGGPFFVTEPSPGFSLPKGLRYGAFSVSQAEAAWHLGSSCRAMATQVVDLVLPPQPYDTNLRKRLKRAERDLRIEPIASSMEISKLHDILSARPECGSRNLVDTILRAQEAGFGKLWGCYRLDDGRLDGAAGILFDEVTGYSPLLARRLDAHMATSAALTHHYLAYSRARGLQRHDIQAGHLTGIRQFNARFGAKPTWYGQVRLAKGPLWKTLEWGRGLTNIHRL